MPQHRSLKMHRIPFPYFCHMVDDNAFAPLKCELKDVSSTTAILLVYTTSTNLTFIEYVHIRLIVCRVGSQVYKPKSIPAYIKYIKEDARHTRQKLVAERSALKAHSYRMFVLNFKGTMAAKTDPPYCLVYPNIYELHIPRMSKTTSTFKVALLGHGSMSACAAYCSSMLIPPSRAGRDTVMVT